MPGEIVIHGARTHNLKNITVRIPKEKLVVITGPSGSGKSALVLDTLDKEGQRQYWEAMGWFAYGVSRPPVDRIEGLAPTVSVDQHLTNRTPRSTVGTETDIYTYLRVLFAKIGHRPCPGCGRDVPPAHSLDVDVTQDADDPDEPATFPCPHCGAKLPELTMAHFSFNKVAGACPTCTGLGAINQVDVGHLIDESRSVRGGAVRGWVPANIAYQIPNLLQAAAHYGFAFDPDQPVAEFGPLQRDLLLHGVLSPKFRRHFPGVEPPATARAGRFEGVVTAFMRRYAERIGDAKYREKVERHMHSEPCPDCGGTRLRAESRAVTVAGRTIVELAHEPVSDLAAWVDALPGAVEPAEWRMTETLVNELRVRILRVVNVGVGYLTLDRAVPSLSGGEAQRLRLASLLGSELSGVIYVLDEPTVGLHPKDTHMLMEILRHLRDLGNTVLVIEHDLDVVRAADYVIDIGPGAGRGGGSVVAAGTPDEVARAEGSPTGRFLSGVDEVPLPQARRPVGEDGLLIRGARAHNLKDLTVRVPLGALVAVTGVSGSGKSTLVFDVLGRAARRRFAGAGDPPGEHDGIDGWERLDRVVTVDQEPIARRAGSNVATYTDVFAAIRKVYGGLPYSREHGLTEGHFSFNVPGGRCEKCQGAGVLTVSMHFLPAQEVRCPACRGRRFQEAVLGAQYRGHSIADVLDMTVAEALAVFAEVGPVRDRLALLAECGLDYLTLGQPATTLSGGEAQRVKLARELGRRGAGRTLFLLDEPSQGLHPADTARLSALLQRLVDAGHTVVAVEHNLDVVKVADWVIDLGPEGGGAGGFLVAEGTPEQVAAVAGSHTGRLLRPLLGR